MARATRYTNTAIVLHWLMAAMILVAFAMGLYMVDLRISPDKLKLYAWHKWIGVAVFMLAAFRLWWRLLNAPPPAAPMPAWQRNVSEQIHRLFYLFFFAVPVTGWLFSSAKGFPTVFLGILQLPDLIQKNDEWAPLLKQIHLYAGYGLGGLVGLHVLAALKHQFVEKDGLINRMMPGRAPHQKG